MLLSVGCHVRNSCSKQQDRGCSGSGRTTSNNKCPRRGTLHARVCMYVCVRLHYMHAHKKKFSLVCASFLGGFESWRKRVERSGTAGSWKELQELHHTKKGGVRNLSQWRGNQAVSRSTPTVFGHFRRPNGLRYHPSLTPFWCQRMSDQLSASLCPHWYVGMLYSSSFAVCLANMKCDEI